jgi:UDP-2-acetamido-3-amino-2,3-dideoxy-glucuronate N-acetyltransferase
MRRDQPEAYSAHATAVVDEGADIGPGTNIWHFCHVMAGARIGKDCVLGQNVFVAAGAVLGDRVRVQNNVSIYDGVAIEDDVFIGPSAVLTNVTHPRAAIDRRHRFERIQVLRGATIGANATVLPGVVVGRHALVAAGAVVTGAALDYALVMGAPARRVAWVGRHGVRLAADGEGAWRCPESGLRYREVDGLLRCPDLDEDAPLPGGRA